MLGQILIADLKHSKKTKGASLIEEIKLGLLFVIILSLNK